MTERKLAIGLIPDASRKPSIFRVPNAVFDEPNLRSTGFLPDDMIYSDTFRPQFIDELIVKTPAERHCGTSQHIGLDRTQHHVDAFDYFSEIIESPLHYNDLYVTLDPSRASTRRRFPWVNEFWHYVRLVVLGGVVETKHAFVNNTGWGIPTMLDTTALRCRDAETGLFSESNDSSVEGSMVVVDHDENYRPAARSSLVLEERIDVLTCDGKRTRGSLMTGTWKNLLHHTRHLHKLSIVAKAADKLPRIVLDWTQGMWGVDVRVEMEWLEDACLRWPYYHSMLVDVALALHHLPPYVLLEIVDWLPKIEYWSRVRKVRLLESMRDSVRRIEALHTTRSERTKLE